jgi:two-component system, NtrC family, response regulator HydG
MRALIVDDDRDHGESIAEILETRGHAVEIAFTGEDAVDCFRARDFDIVLMDVKLPRMNGVEAFFACKAIRPSARVMMMTGYSVEQLVADALNDGALGVLYKPFAVARLFEVLDELAARDRPGAASAA